MYCPDCGTSNDNALPQCQKCGKPLPVLSQIPSPSDDSVVSTIIPYKNPYALIAYYLGVFSLIPCLGILLGITAFILGIKGLSYAREHPEAKGRVHALVGVWVGGIFGFGYLILTILLMLFSAGMFGMSRR